MSGTLKNHQQDLKGAFGRLGLADTSRFASRLLIGVSAGFVLSFSAAQAFAQGLSIGLRDDSASAYSSLTASGLSQPNAARRFSPEVSLTLGQESYFNRSQPPAGVSDYRLISTRLRFAGGGEKWNAVFDFGGTFAPGVESYQNFEIPEAYVGWSQANGRFPEQKPSNGYRVALGRKLETWSQLDSEWNFGLIQPMNRFDGLRPTEQGLTGLFNGFRSGYIDAMVFASPLFIPEQGAPYALNDGRFTTTSPWFNLPPESLIISTPDKLTPVQYTINMPQVSSVVTQFSGGGILRFIAPTNTGAYAQASFIRKPRNAVSLPFSGELVLASDRSYGDVNVRPQFDYHTVISVDVGYKGELISVNVSGLSEVADNKEAPVGYTYEVIDPLRLLSAGVELKSIGSAIWAPRVRLSYLQSFGGEVQSRGPLSSNGSVFGARFPYSQAVSLSVQSVLIHRASWRLIQAAQWIEELAELGSVVMLDTRLQVGRSWNFGLAIDILGSEKALDHTSTFISRYRGNDRIAGRVSYSF